MGRLEWIERNSWKTNAKIPEIGRYGAARRAQVPLGALQLSHAHSEKSSAAVYAMYFPDRARGVPQERPYREFAHAPRAGAAVRRRVNHSVAASSTVSSAAAAAKSGRTPP